MAVSSTDKKAQSVNNYLIVVALITLLIVAVALVIGKGLVGQVVSNQRLLGQKQQAADSLKADQATLGDLTTQYSAIAPALVGELADALPETADFPMLSATLEQLGNISGVETKSVSAVTASDSTPQVSAASQVGSFDVTVALVGPYSALQTYFHNLEISVRPFRVTQIKFAGSSPALEVSVGLSTFYQGGTDSTIFDKTEPFK